MTMGFFGGIRVMERRRMTRMGVSATERKGGIDARSGGMIGEVAGRSIRVPQEAAQDLDERRMQ